MPNITNITPPRVPMVDDNGYITREWYRFLFNQFILTGSGQSDISVDDLAKAPVAEIENAATLAANIGALQSSPVVIDQIAELQKQLDALKLQVYPQLGTMAALQQDNLPWVTFDTTPQSVPTIVGTVAWDGGTTLGIQMTPNVLQPVGEAQYFYIKADSTITKGQLIMFTGAVGASGVIRGAPATGLTDGQYLIGLAAENIATNGFGLVTSFGHVRGWNTTGAPVGETWADGDILYYNPSVPGGLTKTQPVAPNVKATIAAVVNAAPAGSGDVFVRVSTGSVLGATDSNVQITGLANNDFLQYKTANLRWENVAASSVTVGTATNLAGGSANQIPYQTGVGATSFIVAPTVANTYLNWSGSAFQWSVNPLGTVTSVDVSGGTTGLTFSGGPITTSGTITMAGTLGVGNGGTGQTTYTDGQLLIGNSSGNTLTKATLTAGTGVTITNGNGSITINNAMGGGAPVTKTANFTVAASETWIINNKSGSSCVATLPAASSNTGRLLVFVNYQAQTLVSASSNVVPVAGGAAGTAILDAVAGNWATLVSDGTNWIIMQTAPNNALLLE